MILCSTIRKLAAKNSIIWRLDILPCVIGGIEFPGHREYFATLKQAKIAALIPYREGSTISQEVADMATHYMRT